MLIAQKSHGAVTVLTLTGKFEGGDSKLESTMRKLIDQGCRQVVISFRGVRFLASNGIGVLIAVKKMFDTVGGRLVICEINERSMAVIHVMHLEQEFRIVAGARDALGIFADPPGKAARKRTEAEA